ncbi:CshA/CshB family fibrillar adhesin-related protein [Frondihabitans peucedani]|uniref:Surface adhesin CshA non-repetitive domain-containing protein n=1 Tax=Frondihabitans peucedani TaxID=598626 RepID=A0ABP8E4Q1_9MICO
MQSTTARPSRAGSRPRVRRLAALAASALLACGLALAAGAPASAATPVAAPAATPGSTTAASSGTALASSCDVAASSTSTAASDLCWLDLSGYSAPAATSTAGQRFSVVVDGGYRLSFTLRASGGAVHPTALGAYVNAYLGTRGILTGVTGRPVLSQVDQTTTTTLALSDIRVVDSNDQPAAAFTLVGADAESTDAGESITWRSDVPLESTKYVPLADACQGSLTGFASKTVVCAGAGEIGEHRDGTAMVAAPDATSFSQTLVGGGEEGVAFAVALPSLTPAAATVSSPSTTAHAPSAPASSGDSVTWLGGSAALRTPSLIGAALLLAAAVLVLVARRRRIRP